LIVDVQDVVVFFLSADTTGVRLGKHLPAGAAALTVTSPSVARSTEHPGGALLWGSFSHDVRTKTVVRLL
jgi:hypothetical protein